MIPHILYRNMQTSQYILNISKIWFHDSFVEINRFWIYVGV